MGRKKKEKSAPKELTAPFYMLTYGDLMTLLLTFFVLLFSMSTLEVIKFQAQIGALQGALGISKLYSHAPMQVNLPSPSIKQAVRIVSKSTVKPSSLDPKAEYPREDLTEPVQHDDNDQIEMIKALGSQGDIQIMAEEDDVILVLPTYGVFTKGSYTIDPNDLEVKKARPIYTDLAKQVSRLIEYDVYFVGHTDSLPAVPRPGSKVSNNMELGFFRAINMYEYFFSKYLKDRSRITFSSQGDNVPIIPNAQIDSERRKNRRVEIHLKKGKN